MNSETITRIMLLELREQNKLEFPIDTPTVKTITFYMTIKKYDTLFLLYGDKFITSLLEMLIDVENYEECAEIQRQITEVKQPIMPKL